MKATLLQAEWTAQNALLAAALEQSRQDNALLKEENKILREKLAALLRQLFGRKSEQLDSAQLELLLLGLGDTVVDVPAPAPAAPALTPPPLPATRTTRRIPVPDHLEVRRGVIEPDVVYRV